MKIDKIQSFVTPKTTGYSSAVGLGLCTWCGISKNKTLKKAHKPLAWITTGITLLHIGLIEYYNHKFRRKQ